MTALTSRFRRAQRSSNDQLWRRVSPSDSHFRHQSTLQCDPTFDLDFWCDLLWDWLRCVQIQTIVWCVPLWYPSSMSSLHPLTLHYTSFLPSHSILQAIRIAWSSVAHHLQSTRLGRHHLPSIHDRCLLAFEIIYSVLAHGPHAAHHCLVGVVYGQEIPVAESVYQS